MFSPFVFSLSLSLALRAPPHSHIRSQRKRRNISTKTETYVKALKRRTWRAQERFLTRVLCSQRNGYDDDYSVLSSRVSGCVCVTALTLGFVVENGNACKCLDRTCILSLMTLVFLMPAELETERREQSVSLLQARPHGACWSPLPYGFPTRGY